MEADWRETLSSIALCLLIASTTTSAGLTAQRQLDTNAYPLARKISDEDMATLALIPDPFHNQWNCTIRPRFAQN